MPDWETRREVADAIMAHPEAELVDFTRDVYRTLFVSVYGEEAQDEVIELGTEAGYKVQDRVAADQLVFEAPSGASEKVRMGGNRLLKPPSDRTDSTPEQRKKSASRQGKDKTDE